MKLEGEGLLDVGDKDKLTCARRPLVAREFSSLSHRLYPATHSPTSPTSTLRAARAHDADLLLSISFTVPPWARQSKFTGIFLYPMRISVF